MNHAHRLGFGAEIEADGTTGFRIWAPAVESLTLEREGQPPVAMQRQADGWFATRVAAPPGTRYRYRLPDGLAVPDPASRLQDGDVHGWSVVFDPRAHEWHNTGWRGRPWHEAVIYELHTGLFRGFNGVADDLQRIRDIGFTAIELMPLNDFPGLRNWGYDGVLPYAPDEAYGHPGQLKMLIDKAHGLGLMVYLDVVYNHFGPDGAYLHTLAGAAFFDPDKHSPWGAAIAHENDHVAAFFIENAIYWLNEYRFDGLRFDAVHAILPPGFAPEMTRRIRAAIEPGRHVHLVMENEHNNAALIGPGRMDAQWADDWHQCMHVMLTGESEGYYNEFQDAAPMLARCLAEGFAFQGQAKSDGETRGQPSGHLPSSSFVFFLQNHDQTGNRAMGERLSLLADREAQRAATALLLLLPQIPLMFMGEEDGATSPFLFFTDHHDELADAVREGRRREFAGFAAFQDPKRREQIPDPNAPNTYELSRLDPADRDPETMALVRQLLRLRHRHLFPRLAGARSLSASVLSDRAVIGRWVMGDQSELLIAMNLGASLVPLEGTEGTLLFESHAGDAARVADGVLPARSTVAFLLERT